MTFKQKQKHINYINGDKLKNPTAQSNQYSDMKKKTNYTHTTSGLKGYSGV